jgi:hypothetical protein
MTNSEAYTMAEGIIIAVLRGALILDALGDLAKARKLNARELNAVIGMLDVMWRARPVARGLRVRVRPGVLASPSAFRDARREARLPRGGRPTCNHTVRPEDPACHDRNPVGPM